MTKAYEIGGPAAQSSLITPIFHAYYEDDLDIGDPNVLADVAEQAAIMSRTEVSSPRPSLQRSREMACISNFCLKE
jgi:predicted DsbA family dithiol-disulfide isomerase